MNGENKKIRTHESLLLQLSTKFLTEMGDLSHIAWHPAIDCD